MQTAVDWLVKRFLLSGNNLLISDVEIAKQIEKEQIMKAFDSGYIKGDEELTHYDIELYYIENYTNK